MLQRTTAVLALIFSVLAPALAQEVHVNDDGTLREVTQIFVNDDGTLREIQEGYVNDNGTLRLFFSAGPRISPETGGVSKTRFNNDCYAGVRFNASGNEDTLGPTNGWVNDRGTWLDSGDVAEVWVQRVVNSGSLNNDDPGTGRLQLNTTREFSVVRTFVGTQSANVTFNFYDAASGGNLLDSVTYNIIAEFTN